MGFRFLHIASCVMFLTLVGCSMGGLMRVSSPIIEANNSELKMTEGVISFDDTSLSVRPANSGGTLLTLGPLIFPVIPVWFDANINRESQFFQISIQIDPSSSSTYNLNLSEIVLKVDGESYKPSGASDFISDTYPVREGNRATVGHNWICDTRVSVNPITNEPQVVPRKGCFVAEFPILTLPPSQEFELEIGGIHSNKEPLPKIHIKFNSEINSFFFLLA